MMEKKRLEKQRAFFRSKFEFVSAKIFDKTTEKEDVRNSDANKNGVSSQKRITFEEAKTMVHRLSERMAIKTVRPEARDYEDWKRKHNIQPGQPVFCITGNYPLIQDTRRPFKAWMVS